MKPELFLLFALGVSSTSACANYRFCHCYDSDGSPNNKATATVCFWHAGPAYEGQLVYDIREYGTGTMNQECHATGRYDFNNCSWREDCQQAGATGDDSSCWCKPLELCD